MCLHGRPCVWLPFAAACCYFYLLMMPAARLVCQRPSSNFPYFRTPLANFLLSHQNSVECGNSKTTRPTLLPSAKCTRSLFQGRTGCGGRPSGWHDIVTCQRLVYLSVYLSIYLSIYLFYLFFTDNQTESGIFIDVSYQTKWFHFFGPSCMFRFEIRELQHLFGQPS